MVLTDAELDSRIIQNDLSKRDEINHIQASVAQMFLGLVAGQTPRLVRDKDGITIIAHDFLPTKNVDLD